MKIIKGDSVRIMTGSDKGKEGRVLKSYPVKNKILIEGVNIVKKHVRPSQDNPQGGIMKKETSIHSSNILYVENGSTVKIGYKILENGSKVRYSKKTNKIID